MPSLPPSPRIANAPRLVHVISTLQVGGAEQFALRLAAAQRSRGLSASVLSLYGGPLATAAGEMNVPLDILGEAAMPVRITRGLVAMSRLRPDVVHVHNFPALNYGLLAQATSPAAVVVTFHGQRGPLRLPSDRQWRGVRAVAAVSEAAAEVLRQACPARREKVHVIHNGVEAPPPARGREAVRAELGAGNRCIGVLPARVDGMKGHETLLRALALLPPSVPVAVWIAGDGAERARLEALATELGLAGRARFLGFRADVPDLLHAADFFVLPSRAEGLPLSLLEAMAAGLPAVATPVGGVPEVLCGPEYGLLVPVEDPPALAEAMTKLAASPELRRRLGAAGAARVREHFSWDGMVDAYFRLYARFQEGLGAAAAAGSGVR